MEENSYKINSTFSDIEASLADVAKGKMLLSADVSNGSFSISILEKNIRNLYYDEHNIQFTVEPDIDMKISKSDSQVIDISDEFDFGYIIQNNDINFSIFFNKSRQ